MEGFCGRWTQDHMQYQHRCYIARMGCIPAHLPPPPPPESQDRKFAR